MRALVIENKNETSSFIKKWLKTERFAVDVANNSETSLYLTKTNNYDFIIIDIMLPEKDDIKICREIRHQKKRNLHTPIIILTTKSDIKSKIIAFNAGADDYLIKPFSFDELLVRIRALLRRGQQYKENRLVFHDLILDSSTYKVMRAKKPIKLSRKEFSLLEYLIRNPKIVLRRDQILEHVWDYNADIFTNTVDAHISFLRKKMDDGFKKKLIHTIHGVGYKLDTSD